MTHYNLSDSIELKFWRILQRALSRTARDSMVRVPLVFVLVVVAIPVAGRLSVAFVAEGDVVSLTGSRGSTHRFIDEFQFAHINDKGHAFGDGLFLEIKSTVAALAFASYQTLNHSKPVRHPFAHPGQLYLPLEQPYFYRHPAAASQYSLKVN